MKRNKANLYCPNQYGNFLHLNEFANQFDFVWDKMACGSDTDLLNKNRELLDIAKLCVAEGELGENGQTFIIVQQSNGLSRLLWAIFDANQDKWISSCSYEDVVQRSMRILKDLADREKWRVRSTSAYTRQGTYLPQVMPKHVEQTKVHIVSEDNVIEEQGDSEEALGSVPEMRQHTTIGLRRAMNKFRLGNCFSDPL